MTTHAAPTLVVGYDGSELSRAALDHAAAAVGPGRLVVVHVCPQPPGRPGEPAHELLRRDHERRAQALLDAVLLEGSDRLADVDWERCLVHGSPARQLVDVAGDVDADAIVVGSHGYGRMSSLLGSVSQDLLRCSDRPVVVIPVHCARGATPEVGPRA